MKRFVWMVMSVWLLACGDGSTDTMWHLQEVGDVIESHPDSAAVLLSEVEVKELTEEEAALYGLLKTMADYKTHHKERLSDSLISSSINYYDQHSDRWHRASAYYYRGCVRYYHKQNVEAIRDYKTAEALAERLDDELLRNKIYEMLAYANYSINNKPEILRYSLKLLDSSYKMRDSMMLARSHSMVATGYSNIGQIDSAYVYVIKSLDYIDAVDAKTQSELFFNVATYYNETGNTEKAEQCLKDRVLKNANDKRGYLTMARIRKQQGKTEEAIVCAKQAMETSDHQTYRKALDLLAELYSEHGDSSKAYVIKKRCDEFADSLERTNKTAETALWQMNYDEDRLSNALNYRMAWMLGIIIALSIMVALTIVFGTWWHRRKVILMSFRQDEDARRISELRAKIEQHEKSGKDSGDEMARLKEELESRMERISGMLLVGTQMYNQLQQRKCIAEATAKELQCLVDYYAQLRPKRWQEWERKYKNLSTAQYVFLIMQDDLHYDDEAVADALNVKRTSVRSMRSRIKGRER